MITRTVTGQPTQSPNLTWQQDLASGPKTVGELLELLQISPREIDGSDDAHKAFPLRVPRSFVAKMQPGNPRDPLLLQVIPSAREMALEPGYGTDPLKEDQVSPVPGLLHKYHGRVLLVATGACAIHCRYCFRRHFPYADHQPQGQDWQKALSYIAEDPTIEEVILSGGDPLALNNEKFFKLAHAITQITHVQRLRIHTRLPVVLPQRVNDGLQQGLARLPKPVVMVLHANHALELDDPAVHQALERLTQARVRLLNQAVLLRNINDNLAAQQELSEALFMVGVMPYYLHLVDRVHGAAHFEVSESEAQTLLWQLAQRLPGYLVPKLVREVPGIPAKLPIPIGG